MWQSIFMKNIDQAMCFKTFNHQLQGSGPLVCSFLLEILAISFVIFLYFFSLQVCNLIFFIVCCHPLFVYVPSIFYIAFICH